MTTSIRRVFIASTFTCFLLLISLFFLSTEQALAEELDDLQTAVEQTSQDYNLAVETVNSLEQQITENTARIEEIEATLPSQQEACDDAVESLYKFQQDTSSFLSLVLSSQSFSDFINTIEYLDRFTTHSLAVISKTSELKAELEQTEVDLENAMSQAVLEREYAAQALSDAQAAREEAMQQAVEEAAAQAAEQTAALASAGDRTPVPSVTSDQVNWSASKEAFVSDWTLRIDAYLVGSPLAGQGKTFAAAAWDYGVDPRWSPAISYVESSKGVNCFRPYNAWGWGTKSWTSWEEAIYAHVSGLARVYGSTLTYEAAEKYCPTSPSGWYNNTLAQMQLI